MPYKMRGRHSEVAFKLDRQNSTASSSKRGSRKGRGITVEGRFSKFYTFPRQNSLLPNRWKIFVPTAESHNMLKSFMCLNSAKNGFQNRATIGTPTSITCCCLNDIPTCLIPKSIERIIFIVGLTQISPHHRTLIRPYYCNVSNVQNLRTNIDLNAFSTTLTVIRPFHNVRTYPLKSPLPNYHRFEEWAPGSTAIGISFMQF